MHQRYHLNYKVRDDRFIYIKIKKSTLGLKQVVLLICDHLKNFLVLYIYYSILGKISLWNYKTRSAIVYLCVDNVGIKFQSKKDTSYLCTIIGANLKYTVYQEGKNYCGLNLDYNYSISYADISMQKYVPDIMKKLLYAQKILP